MDGSSWRSDKSTPHSLVPFVPVCMECVVVRLRKQLQHERPVTTGNTRND